MAVYFQGNKRKRVFRKGIILVEQRAPFARCHFERGVRAGGDVPVPPAKGQFYPRVGRGDILQERPHLWIGGRVVGNTEFPVFVDLAANGLDGLFKKLNCRIVNRQNDGDPRMPGENAEVSSQRDALCRRESIELRYPVWILVRSHFWAAFQRDYEFGEA